VEEYKKPTCWIQPARGRDDEGKARDVKGFQTVPLAAYCRRLVVHRCRLRFRSFQQPVEVGGTTVRPGDVQYRTVAGWILSEGQWLAVNGAMMLLRSSSNLSDRWRRVLVCRYMSADGGGTEKVPPLPDGRDVRSQVYFWNVSTQGRTDDSASF
jgi:hypothetical protein